MNWQSTDRRCGKPKKQGAPPAKKCAPRESTSISTEMHSALTGQTDQLLLALTAKAATVSCTLYPTASGYLLSRQAWGMTRHCPDLRVVSAVLKMMGAR